MNMCAYKPYEIYFIISTINNNGNNNNKKSAKFNCRNFKATSDWQQQPEYIYINTSMQHHNNHNAHHHRIIIIVILMMMRQCNQCINNKCQWYVNFCQFTATMQNYLSQSSGLQLGVACSCILCFCMCACVCEFCVTL